MKLTTDQWKDILLAHVYECEECDGAGRVMRLKKAAPHRRARHRMVRCRGCIDQLRILEAMGAAPPKRQTRRVKIRERDRRYSRPGRQVA